MASANVTFDIHPYQFEPLARNRNLPTDEIGSDSEEEASEQDRDDIFDDRIGNLNW